MKKRNLIFAVLILFVSKSFGQAGIIDTILNKSGSFYYLDTENYPVDDPSLPIGIFDSGIGGLTVLDAIVNYDENNNKTMSPGKDGLIDFKKEKFIYLGDQANMPYGNYSAEDKDGLLREHIIKDVQFMLGNNYYISADSKVPQTDKSNIKALVIACNTATAYGKETIENFLIEANLNIKVVGVIDAGVRGALEKLAKDEDATIAVMATVGTVSSKGYVNTIYSQMEKLGYYGDIQVFQQGGIGIAEAVDEDSDYYDRNLNSPRDNYKGPGLKGNTKVDKTLMDIYNFDFDRNKMLCDSENSDDCNLLQINDAENYVRFHLVSLLEKIRNAEVKSPLKSIILGCTHYPYLTDEISNILGELYRYKNEDGSFRYRPFMNENIELIDPAVNTAKELFEYLQKEELFVDEGDIQKSEFFISVPNKDNPNIQVDKKGGFTYSYKYGRNEGEIQEYIKVVPFSRKTISKDILERLKNQLPFSYEIIEGFNRENPKVKNLDAADRI